MSVPEEYPSPNYDYLVARTKAWPSGQQLLDFGCSSGTLVRRARSAGVEAVGADAYEQHSPGLDNTGDAAPYLHRIENDRLPFPDQSFDVVTSNMVFEHVQPDRLPTVLSQIRRVLRPGGVLFAAFPVRETWFEGHLHLYFPHTLDRWPRLQRAYLHSARAIGLGRDATVANRTEWVDRCLEDLDSVIFLHRRDTVRALLQRHGFSVECAATDYMRYRLGPRRAALVAKIPGADRLLRFVCAKRAGEVLVCRAVNGGGEPASGSP
jgi:SAM-dependent methyltransferase